MQRIENLFQDGEKWLLQHNIEKQSFSYCLIMIENMKREDGEDFNQHFENFSKEKLNLIFHDVTIRMRWPEEGNYPIVVPRILIIHNRELIGWYYPFFSLEGEIVDDMLLYGKEKK